MAWKGIAASSRAGQGMTVEAFRAHVAELRFTTWRPAFMVLHNTGAPTLAQWNSYPEAQRIRNLERYYRDEQGWSSGPHAFVDNDTIWPFTRFTTTGTHSPSFNGSGLGIELVGDYAREDDDRGLGFDAKMMCVATFAILMGKLGLEPDETTIRLHKEDPRTTHDCPGKDIDKAEFIDLVREYMGEGGTHATAADTARILTANYQPRPAPVRPPEGAVLDSVQPIGLNLRDGSSAAARILAVLPAGQRVAVLGEAMNGRTRWLRVWCRLDEVQRVGWVAARYITMD